MIFLKEGNGGVRSDDRRRVLLRGELEGDDLGGRRKCRFFS